MASIEECKRQRKSLKCVITRIYNYCVKNEGNAEDILARYVKLEEKFKEFEIVQNGIEDQDMTSEQAEIEEKIREEIEEKYFFVKALSIRVSANTELDKTVINNTEQNNTDSQVHITNALDTSTRSQAALHELLGRFTSTPVSNIQRGPI